MPRCHATERANAFALLLHRTPVLRTRHFASNLDAHTLQGCGNGHRPTRDDAPNARDFPRSGSHCGTSPRASRTRAHARFSRGKPSVFAWSAHAGSKCSVLELAGMDVADRSIRQSDRKIRGCCHDRVRNPLRCEETFMKFSRQIAGRLVRHIGVAMLALPATSASRCWLFRLWR